MQAENPATTRTARRRGRAKARSDSPPRQGHSRRSAHGIKQADRCSSAPRLFARCSSVPRAHADAARRRPSPPAAPHPRGWLVPVPRAWPRGGHVIDSASCGRPVPTRTRRLPAHDGLDHERRRRGGTGL